MAVTPELSLFSAVQDGDGADSWAVPIAAESWATTGLTPDCFSPVRVQADAQLADTLAMLANGAVRAA